MPEVTIAMEPKDESSETDNLIAEWSERESNIADRGKKWYVSIALGALLIAGFFVWQKQYSGVFLIAVSAVFVLFFSKNKHKLVKVALYEKGILIDERTYHFEDIKEFSFIEINNVLTLKLTLAGGMFSGYVTAPVKEEYIEQVQEYLSEILPENHDHFSSFIDKIGGFFQK